MWASRVDISGTAVHSSTASGDERLLAFRTALPHVIRFMASIRLPRVSLASVTSLIDDAHALRHIDFVAVDLEQLAPLLVQRTPSLASLTVGHSAPSLPVVAAGDRRHIAAVPTPTTITLPSSLRVLEVHVAPSEVAASIPVTVEDVPPPQQPKPLAIDLSSCPSLTRLTLGHHGVHVTMPRRAADKALPPMSLLTTLSILAPAAVTNIDLDAMAVVRACPHLLVFECRPHADRLLNVPMKRSIANPTPFAPLAMCHAITALTISNVEVPPRHPPRIVSRCVSQVDIGEMDVLAALPAVKSLSIAVATASLSDLLAKLAVSRSLRYLRLLNRGYSAIRTVHHTPLER